MNLAYEALILLAELSDLTIQRDHLSRELLDALRRQDANNYATQMSEHSRDHHGKYWDDAWGLKLQTQHQEDVNKAQKRLREKELEIEELQKKKVELMSSMITELAASETETT